MLGCALTKHTKSIIFRREAKRLREIVDQSREIIGANGRFNENLLIWRDLPGGKVLELGGVKDEADVENWRGRPHDFYGFDELTEFTRNQFVHLTAWLRTTIPGQKCRVVAAFNPPRSSDGEWVIDYFAPWIDDRHPNPAKAGEIRWFAALEGKEIECDTNEPFTHKGELLRPRSRTFIPAGLRDNPFLNETDYESVLQSLSDDRLRRQLLYGDFSSSITDADDQTIPTAWVDAAIKRGQANTNPAVDPDIIGIDVSRGGEDQTVFAKRYGNWIAPLVKYPGRIIVDGQAVVTRLLPHLAPGVTLNIDENGVGSTAYDQLKDLDYSIVGTIWSERTTARDKSGKFGFVNTRARDWWHLRELLDPQSGEDVCLPDDKELRSDLIAPRYGYRGGRIYIELKEDTKKRRGKSPDCGDAVVMAFSAAGGLPGFRILG